MLLVGSLLIAHKLQQQLKRREMREFLSWWSGFFAGIATTVFLLFLLELLKYNN